MNPSRDEFFFPTTSWGRLRPEDAASDEGFCVLARGYLGPIAAYLRTALAFRDDRAEEAAQDFFLWMMETGFLRKADPSRGRFRAFLKTALRNYVTDAHRRESAQRRGGGKSPLSLSSGAPDESTPAIADATAANPEFALDDAWRKEVFTRALDRTDAEFRASGKEKAAAVFHDYLDAEGTEIDYGEIAARRGVTKVDVSNWLMRAKAAFRSHVKDIVLETVDGPLDLEDELDWLLGGGRG